MKSTHECQQEINNNGLLVESTCAEEHVFRPFSSGSSGAVTEVYYKIRFNKESRGITSRQGEFNDQGPIFVQPNGLQTEMQTFVFYNVRTQMT